MPADEASGAERLARHIKHGSARSAAPSATAISALIAVNVAVFTVYFSRQGLLQALVPLYSGNVLGFRTEVIGMLLSTSAIISVFALSPSGFLADRYGRMQVFLPGVVCLIVGAFIIPFAQDLTQLMLAVVFLSMGGMTISIPAVLVGDMSSRKSLSRNMGNLRFLTDLGIFAGPVTLASLVDYFGFRVPAFADIGLLIVTTASLVLLLPGSLLGRRTRTLPRQGARRLSEVTTNGRVSRGSPQASGDEYFTQKDDIVQS